MGGCGVGVGGPIEFAIQCGEEIPAGAIFRFELCGPFGMGKCIGIAVHSRVGGGEV